MMGFGGVPVVAGCDVACTIVVAVVVVVAMMVGHGKGCFVLIIIGLGRSVVGACGMVILGPAGDSNLVGELVFRSVGTSHSDWISTGELWICQSGSLSELDSACCFPLSGGPASLVDSESSASFSDFDGGLLSLS